MVSGVSMGAIDGNRRQSMIVTAVANEGSPAAESRRYSGVLRGNQWQSACNHHGPPAAESRRVLQSSAIMCTHVQSSALKAHHLRQRAGGCCNQVQSCALKCTQVHSRLITCGREQEGVAHGHCNADVQRHDGADCQPPSEH